MYSYSTLYMRTAGHLATNAQQNTTNSKDQAIGWQTGPNVRGTWSILWGCVATLILCVYTANHMPISRKNSLAWRSLSRSFWFTFGLAFPEFITWMAWSEWRYARLLTNKVVKLREERLARSHHIPKYMHEWSKVHSFFVVMGGLAMIRDDRENDDEKAYLTADGVVTLMMEMQDDALAVLSEDAISGRSKADFLAKAITLLQAVHTLALVLVRASTHHTVSALEVMTCGYVVTAAIQLGLWWRKPYDVQDPIILTVRDGSALKQRDCGHYDWVRHVRPDLNEVVYTIKHPPWSHGDGNVGYATIDNGWPDWAVNMSCIGSAVLGGLHLTLWNAFFPTPVERWMWRISSIIVTGAGLFLGLECVKPLMELPSWGGRKTNKKKKQQWRTCIGLAGHYLDDYFVSGSNGYAPRWWTWARNRLYGSIWVAARFYVIVECFVSLRRMPADVYVVPAWSAILPNFG